MRLMALDVGKRRIGVAVSDPMGLIARPHSTIPRNRHSPAKIAELVGEMGVGMILVGLPLHLNGTEGGQAEDVRGFMRKLEPAVPGLELKFVDERLTTVEAQERLYDRRGGWRKQRDHIDAFAAAALMERYLNER